MLKSNLLGGLDILYNCLGKRLYRCKLQSKRRPAISLVVRLRQYRGFMESNIESVIIIDYLINGLFYSVFRVTRRTTYVNLSSDFGHYWHCGVIDMITPYPQNHYNNSP